MVNAATAILVGGYENLNRIINFSPTVFDVLFDSRLGVNSAFFDIERLQRSQIYRFKLINQFRRFETSYRNVVRQIQQCDWREEDKTHFEKLWNTIDIFDDINQEVTFFTTIPQLSIKSWRTGYHVHTMDSRSALVRTRYVYGTVSPHA